MSRAARTARAERSALEGLDSIEAAQVRRCARTLLRRPLLRADGPEGDALPAVRRYSDRLQALFAHYLGYRLAVEPTFARLYKSGRTPDGVRGAHKANGAAFTPRAYAYLCLVLAELTGTSGQVLLSGLVDQVRAAGAEAGLDLGCGIVDRRALVAALRHLIDLGVLSETDGSVGPWAEDAGREALLTVDVELLGHLVAAPLGRLEGPAQLAAGGAPGPGDDVRYAVRRRLVEDPVVLNGDLTADQRDWLRTRLRQESELLEELLGLHLEVRAEGVLAVDPEGYLSDLLYPGHGTLSRIALLTADAVLRDGGGGGDAGAHDAPSETPDDGRVPVSYARLEEAAADIVARYPKAWSKEAVRDTARLARSVAHTLVQAGLARAGTAPDGSERVELSPAAARYRPRPDGPEGDGDEDEAQADGARPAPVGPGEGQESLFAVGDDLP
ncbi:TIGR02678 family protein [Nocardiopsis suaedae]|uniref:TIGR02678 family protein n=1 Tax=Nocardiopsis suaedae TaxID=3018444 RepID=A0ABT4TQH5_9ACTN|nr:TIGR02678 family protein [Nocardiopsis suaedae]MDA2806935.1 TIGR02678 family protein [Nocardiopsis suaedae]